VDGVTVLPTARRSHDAVGFLSVVVPVKGTAPHLARALEALAASDYPRTRWELIVVDDSGDPDVADLAARWADSVVRLPGPTPGLAYARNRGVEIARGDIVVFVDADVCVQGDALRHLVTPMMADERVAAVSGAFDVRPSTSLVSRYMGLRNAHEADRTADDADAYWSGFGAIRTAVFVELGMFNEWRVGFPHADAVENGARIRSLGHRLVRSRDARAEHLHEWTLGDALRATLRDSGTPWTRLPQDGRSRDPQVRRLRGAQRAAEAVAWIAAVAGITALATSGAASSLLGITALAGVATLLVLRSGVYGAFERAQGAAFAIAVLPLDLVMLLVSGLSRARTSFVRGLVGEPRPDPTTEAFVEVGVKVWPPIPAKRQPATSRGGAR